DGVGDREVNFRTASLGGVEGFEYPLAILRREAGARVADSDGWDGFDPAPTTASDALRIRSTPPAAVEFDQQAASVLSSGYALTRDPRGRNPTGEERRCSRRQSFYQSAGNKAR
ncbi:hypothetical protein, partial [Paraburkholderia youngii]|uniref:hypothetical protein n=1 Tax=Paraburkholderia youngii TaxID=2782701 RepID=UPI001C377664